MKKLLAFFIPLMTLMVCGTACDSEPDPEYPSTTYYWGVEKNLLLEIVQDKAYIAFCPENEEKLKTELSKLDLTLTEIKDGDNLSYGNELTEEASGILRNYRTAVVAGDYRKAEAIRPLTIGWSPYYKVIDEDDFMPGRE